MKEYWIVNGMYACESRERAEALKLGHELVNQFTGYTPPPKKIERAIVVSDEIANWLNMEEGRKNLIMDAAFNKSGL